MIETIWITKGRPFTPEEIEILKICYENMEEGIFPTFDEYLKALTLADIKENGTLIESILED